MVGFSSKQFFQAFVTTLLLLVGLPQFIAPILGLHQFSGAAHAQVGNAIRLSRQVRYDNADSTNQFRDDRLSYSFSLENQGATTITGIPINIDGQVAERVMVASVIPAGTYLAGVPTPPAGWQVVYSTDERTQTGRGNSDSRLVWTTRQPVARGAARVAFVRAAIAPYEITDHLGFSLLLENIPAYAPGIYNTAEVYGNTGGTSGLITRDENFYADIEGTEEVAQNRAGKPTAAVPQEPLIAELPAVAPPPAPAESIEAVEPQPRPQMPVAEPTPPAPVAQSAAPNNACEFSTVSPQFSVGVSSAGNGTDAFPSVGGFIPVAQTPGRNLTYVNAVGRLDDFENVGTNVTVGHRFYNDGGDRIYGTHFSYDLANEQGATFNQVGVGIETLGQVWDASLNMYVPLEGAQTVDNGTKTVDPLTTVEGEVSAKLLSIENGGEVRAYVAPYYYTEINTVGARVGITAEPINGVSVGASVQTDEVFDTQVAFNVNYTIGSRSSNQASVSDADDFATSVGTGNPCGQLDRLGDPVRRTAPVRFEVESADPVNSVGLQMEVVEELTTCLPAEVLIDGMCSSLSVSDRTLKENIEYLGETESGFKLYAFDYINNFSLPRGRFVGVMAQDLLQDHPEAIVTRENNTYAVNYMALGLRMVSYDQWEEYGLDSVTVR